MGGETRSRASCIRPSVARPAAVPALPGPRLCAHGARTRQGLGRDDPHFAGRPAASADGDVSVSPPPISLSVCVLANVDAVSGPLPGCPGAGFCRHLSATARTTATPLASPRFASTSPRLACMPMPSNSLTFNLVRIAHLSPVPAAWAHKRKLLASDAWPRHTCRPLVPGRWQRLRDSDVPWRQARIPRRRGQGHRYPPECHHVFTAEHAAVLPPLATLPQRARCLAPGCGMVPGLCGPRVSTRA